MQVVNVTTKDELERAVKNNTEKIVITGDLAKKIISTQKKKSVAKKVGISSIVLSAVAAVAGLVAAPLTGGASAVASASFATVALTGGGITLTTAEVAILVVGALGALGISVGIINIIAKNYNVKISAGSTTVELMRK